MLLKKSLRSLEQEEKNVLLSSCFAISFSIDDAIGKLLKNIYYCPTSLGKFGEVISLACSWNGLISSFSIQILGKRDVRLVDGLTYIKYIFIKLFTLLVLTLEGHLHEFTVT